MATSVGAVSTAPAAPNGSANKNARLLGKLAKLWTVHNVRSLEVRRKIGSLLNARLGNPTTRQRRGRSVLKQAAETLHVAPSELNRMRWFSHLSKDEKSCWGEVPNEDRTWTEFKKILPGLIGAVKGKRSGKHSSGERRNTTLVASLFRSVESVTAKLRAGNLTVDGTQRADLIQRLRELASAASDIVGIRFHVETEEDETGGHGLTQALADSGCENSLTASQRPMDVVMA